MAVFGPRELPFSAPQPFFLHQRGGVNGRPCLASPVAYNIAVAASRLEFSSPGALLGFLRLLGTLLKVPKGWHACFSFLRVLTRWRPAPSGRDRIGPVL